MEKIIESLKESINKYNKMTAEERETENELLNIQNNGIMVCWCCEHFQLCDNNYEGDCKLMQYTVPAFQIVCPNFILNSGVFTKRKTPDYCVNHQNKEHENE